MTSSGSSNNDKYATTYKGVGTGTTKDEGVKKREFFKSTDNWMNFQPDFDGTFKTTQRVDYASPSDQEPKFKMKETFLTKNPDALEEYRKKYTNAGHNFNRTYLGDEKGYKEY